MSTPVIIIARDRVSYLDNLVKWLERSGNGERIYIVDNDSTYEPLLEYYRHTPHTVYRWENHGASSPWTCPHLERVRKHEQFVVTDHDVLPNPDCPENILEVCEFVLEKMNFIDKVGPSLEITDIPDHNYRKPAVLKWEGQFWDPSRWMPKYGVWNSPIDTTFALYRPGTPYKITEAVRLDYPFVFRHEPWYIDFSNLSEEEQYYMDHAHHDISNWSRAELPNYLEELL